jgi:hypothetical protein
MIIRIIGVLVLGAVSFVSTFVRRLPGGVLALAGLSIIVAMFAFTSLMTSTMELQYGPRGTVVESAVYTIGGFLCVLGYACLACSSLRNRSHER